MQHRTIVIGAPSNYSHTFLHADEPQVVSVLLSSALVLGSALVLVLFLRNRPKRASAAASTLVRVQTHARSTSERSLLVALLARRESVVSVRSAASSFAAPLIIAAAEPGKPPRVFSLRGRSFSDVQREARATMGTAERW